MVRKAKRLSRHVRSFSPWIARRWLPVRTLLEVAVKSHEKYPVVIDAKYPTGGNTIVSSYIGVRRDIIKKVKILWRSISKAIALGKISFQINSDRAVIRIVGDYSFNMTQDADMITDKIFA